MPIALVLTLSTALFVASKGNRVLVTLAAVDAGANGLELGMMLAMTGLFPLLLAVRAGRVADRFSNQLLVYTGIAGYAISVALPCFWPGLTVFYVSSALAGFTSMLFVLAFNAAPPGRSAEAVAMRLAVSYGSHVFLPPLYGVFAASLGLAPVFWICALCLGGGATLHRENN